MKQCLTTAFFLLSFQYINAQNVGIGTTSPKARLHVADSAVLFTGPEYINEFTDDPRPFQEMVLA